MMSRLLTNKYLRALGWTILISASLHLLILGYRALVAGDWQIINYFNIIDLDLFFPRLLAYPGSSIYGIITVLLLYALALWRLRD